MRLTSDGQIRACLFSMTETDVRAILRNQDLSHEQIRESLVKAFHSTIKASYLGMESMTLASFNRVRPMSAIGG